MSEFSGHRSSMDARPGSTAWRAVLVAAAALASAAIALGLVSSATGQGASCFGSAATVVGSGTIVGTDGDDVIVGSDGNDVLGGGGGNDKLCGGNGNDRMGGGPGDDELDGGPGDDELHGGPGADTILGGEDDDVLKGGPDTDVCDGGPGQNTAATSGFEACETATNAGAGSGEAPTRALRAGLSRRQEVPRPRGARRARGAFRARLTLTEQGGRLRWRLSFRRLTGGARAAHIHRGRRGKTGPAVITLCRPCSSPERGRSVVRGQALTRAILRGRTYVNVHTRRNPKGEIRGQIVQVEE